MEIVTRGLGVVYDVMMGKGSMAFAIAVLGLIDTVYMLVVPLANADKVWSILNS
jgi:hypothetical protein